MAELRKKVEKEASAVLQKLKDQERMLETEREARKRPGASKELSDWLAEPKAEGMKLKIRRIRTDPMLAATDESDKENNQEQNREEDSEGDWEEVTPELAEDGGPVVDHEIEIVLEMSEDSTTGALSGNESHQGTLEESTAETEKDSATASVESARVDPKGERTKQWILSVDPAHCVYEQLMEPLEDRVAQEPGLSPLTLPLDELPPMRYFEVDGPARAAVAAMRQHLIETSKAGKVPPLPRSILQYRGTHAPRDWPIVLYLAVVQLKQELRRLANQGLEPRYGSLMHRRVIALATYFGWADNGLPELFSTPLVPEK